MFTTVLIALHIKGLLFAMSVGNLAAEYCRSHDYVSNTRRDVSCVSIKSLDTANRERNNNRSRFGKGRR